MGVGEGRCHRRVSCRSGLFLSWVPGGGWVALLLRWLVRLIISLGEMITWRSSSRCKLCFTGNRQDYIYIYSAVAASLLQTRTNVRCRQVGKGYSADLPLA